MTRTSMVNTRRMALVPCIWRVPITRRRSTIMVAEVAVCARSVSCNYDNHVEYPVKRCRGCRLLATVVGMMTRIATLTRPGFVLSHSRHRDSALQSARTCDQGFSSSASAYYFEVIFVVAAVTVLQLQLSPWSCNRVTRQSCGGESATTEQYPASHERRCHCHWQCGWRRGDISGFFFLRLAG
jgi:hypothetical protein